MSREAIVIVQALCTTPQPFGIFVSMDKIEGNTIEAEEFEDNGYYDGDGHGDGDGDGNDKERLKLRWADPDLEYDVLPQPYSWLLEMVDTVISDSIDDYNAAKQKLRQTHIDSSEIANIKPDFRHYVRPITYTITISITIP